MNTQIERLQARVSAYQAKEAECINSINQMQESIRQMNENRLRFSGAILGLMDQIADLKAEEAAAKSPDLAVLPKPPKSKSPLRHAAKK